MWLGSEEVKVWSRVGKTMREKERGRRNRTERAKKWREWALMILLDSVITPQKSTRDWAELDMVGYGYGYGSLIQREIELKKVE